MLDLSPVLSNTPQSSSRARLKTCAVIIPTYNAARYWPLLRQGLALEGIDGKQVLIVDSSSTDNTRELAKESGYQLITIRQSEFRHGATRQLAAEYMEWAEILIFLTQDAIPCGDTPLATLTAAFAAPLVGAAYGRQLPRPEADGIEQHARLFNYPDLSIVRDLSDREILGFRTAFFSNSFAAYRRTAFDEVGGFPKDVIVSEEVSVVARMLLRGWSIAYVADAKVIHSHPMNIPEEFSRYFDIATHHARERFVINHFGKTGGEGRRFLVSEFRFLLRNSPQLIPIAAIRNGSKWIAYQVGLRERFLPIWMKRLITGQPTYWEEEHGPHPLSARPEATKPL